MPTTVRIVLLSTDPQAGIEDNLDFVQSTENSRHERWSIYSGQDPIRIYWPLDGQLSVFLQLWQPQPAINESIFKITYPSSPLALGWETIVPAVGRVPLLLSKPATTDIVDISADPYSIEAEVVYF